MASDSEEEGNKKKPSFDFDKWTGSGVVKFDLGSSNEQSPERQCNNNSVECIYIDTTPSPQPQSQRRSDYAINADGHICIDMSPSPQRNNKAVSTSSMLQDGSSRNYLANNSKYHSTSHLTGAASMNPEYSSYSSSEEDAGEEGDKLDSLFLQQGIKESLAQSGLAQSAVGSDSDDESDENKKLPAIENKKLPAIQRRHTLFAPQGVSNSRTALSHLARQDGSPYLVNTTSDHGTSHLTSVAANPVYSSDNTVHDSSVEVVLGDNLRPSDCAASQQDLADHHDVKDEQGPSTRGAGSFASIASAASKAASSVATAVNVASIFCRSNRSDDRTGTYEQKKEANANYTGPKRAKQAAATVESSLDEIISDLLYEDGYYEESSDDDDDDDDYNDEEDKDEDDDEVELMEVGQARSDTTHAADLPNPSSAEQKRLYDQYSKDLDAANRLYKQHTNKTRDVTGALLDRLHHDKVQRGEAYTIGQGICGVPEHRGGINFEGEGAPDNVSKFYGNHSTQGARCIADGLPPNGRRSRRVFQFNTKQLRLFGLNVRCVFMKQCDFFLSSRRLT